jgi:hypothetical protein
MQMNPFNGKIRPQSRIGPNSGDHFADAWLLNEKPGG